MHRSIRRVSLALLALTIGIAGCAGTRARAEAREVAPPSASSPPTAVPSAGAPAREVGEASASASPPVTPRAEPEAEALLDTDGDGIPDRDDRCPTEIEVFDGVGDEDGCPDGPIIDTIICQQAIPSVYFGTGSPGSVTQASTRTLERVVRILRDFPELRIEVVGHADPREGRSEQERAERSAARAERVRASLVERGGIDEGRLEVRGAGGALPVDAGRTAEGRARNRRVELVVIER